MLCGGASSSPAKVCGRLPKGARLVLGVLFLLAAPVAQAQDASPIFPRDVLTVEKTAGGGETFAVEVATTPLQLHDGLMYRPSMPADSGMVFLFDPPQVVQFWMKNTLIPLDLLFARADGVIIKIAANRQPHDESLVSSDVPVAQVLEINGGEAEKRGLKPGDKIVFKPKRR